MEGFRQGYLKFMGVITKIELVISEIILAALIIVTIVGTLTRYFLRMPFTWIEEFQLACVVWIVFLAGSAAFHEKAHVAIEMVVDLLPKSVQRVINVLIGIVVYGGVKRIANVTDKLVPIMVIIYLCGSLVVLGVNAAALPGVFALIFKSAFSPAAAMGGFAGAGVAAAMRQGMARGTYSTEAGMGSAAAGHAAATTDHPVRQGFWGVFEVMVSGLVICTMSGLVVMCTGMWTEVSSDMAGTMPSLAFQSVFGTGLGAGIVAISMLCFVVSTMIVQVFYGEKYAEFLFGLKASKVAKFIYLLSILLGVLLDLETIYIFLDLILGMMVFVHAYALIAMSGQVAELKKEFFTDPRYYLKDIADKRKRKEAKRAGKA